MMDDQMNYDTEDSSKLLPQRSIKIDDVGFVRLIDWMPRMVPPGRTCEFSIIRSARVSMGKGLDTVERDEALLDYLFRNKHTSPFESVKFSFMIRCPKFVSIQLIRHRTANINEFSQRYREIDEVKYWSPENNIRTSDTTNKQSSVEITDGGKEDTIRSIIAENNVLIDKIIENYHILINVGLAKEQARYCLPSSVYTDLYFTMDLHNFIGFITLRSDHHAQKEIQDYANAMKTLVTPLVPKTMAKFENYRRDCITIYGDELALMTRGIASLGWSKERENEYNRKKKALETKAEEC